MAYSGADPEKLRAAATQFNQLASTLESSAAKVNSMIANPWWGPDADRFRAQWTNESRPSVRAAVAMLRQGADDLRRNAAEQEQVSSASGGAGPVAASTYQTHVAPTGTAGLFSQIAAMKHSYDGVMIQQVVGQDGTTRFIVYLNGTGSADRLTDARNAQVILGAPDSYLTSRISDALKAAGCQPGADGTFKDGPQVMLVGYSQGGMDAQNLAAAHGFNVTDLVTYGSPLTHPDTPGITTVHLRADGDNVPDLPGELTAVASGHPEVALAIRAGLVDGPGDKTPFDAPWSGPSQNIHEYNTGVADPAPITGGHLDGSNIETDVVLGNHGIPSTYETAGADFDKSTAPAVSADQQSLQRFQGDVVQTWNPATTPPPSAAGG